MNDIQQISKLSLIVQSGDVDQIHYAFATASAALAINIPVTMFFTMAASHAVMGSGDQAGWRNMTTGDGRTGADMDAGFSARNIGTMEELISACVALGARFLICEMGLKALDIDMGPDRTGLRPDLNFEVGGLVTFLTDAERDGQIIYI
jgi:peroxiredoxin family protein